MGYIEPSDLGQEESEEEEQQAQVVAKPGSPKVAAAGSPKHSPKVVAAEADSEDDLDMEDEEEEEEGLDASEMPEDEESEEESQSLPPQKAAALTKSPKRKAEDAPGSPAKKPNTGSSDLDDYVKKLVAYVKANGKQNIGQLGSKVPRPNGVPKMKAVLESNADKFLVDGDHVTLW